MLIYLVTIIFAMPPNEAEFIAENVSIKVNIQSNVFAYEVTNLGSSPITAVYLREFAAYDFQAPQGWLKEIKKGIFRSWVDVSANGILPQQKALFSLRVSSRGAVLKKLPLKVQFDSGQVVTIAEVWSPTPEPSSYIFSIAGTMAALFLLQLFIVNRRSQKTATAID